MTVYSFNGQSITGTVDVDDPHFVDAMTLVSGRFSETLSKAQEVLDLLIGSEGDGGLLGEMESNILGSAPSTSINPQQIDTSLTLESSGLSVPSFDSNSLQTIPLETYASPSLSELPGIDTDYSDINEPDSISISMPWAESALPSELFSALKTQILVDLVDGSTGINEDVENAIYARARYRQASSRVQEYNNIVGTYDQLQHSLPAGVYASALADFSIGATKADEAIENGIIETQAKLAQENRKSAMQSAAAVEQLIRQARSEESNRNIDAAKTLLQATLQNYELEIRKVEALWNGRKIKIEAQTEALKGTIEANKGLIDIYTAQYDALKTRIDGVTAYNKGLTDVFVSEVTGFSEAERAIAARNVNELQIIQQRISAADIDLRGQIAEVDAAVRVYTAGMSISERISSDRAQVASHCAIGLYSAVNASASLGYSGNESSNKSYGVSVTGHESHSYEHDPDS